MPWPSSSSGDRRALLRTRSAPKPSTNQWAPTILRSQTSAVQPGPVAHRPRKSRRAAAESADVGEHRAVGPHARVDDADHHPGTADAGQVGRGLSGSRGYGGQAAYGVGLDAGHRRIGRQVPAWAGGEPDGVAVERGGPAVDRGARADRGQGGVLRRRGAAARKALADSGPSLPDVPGPASVMR